MKVDLRALRGAFGRDVETKVFCLVLAGICWAAINRAISYERTIPSVPLTIELQPGEAIESQSESHVRVTVSGSQSDVMALHAEGLQAVVARGKSDTSPTRSLPIGPRSIRGASRVRVVRVEPATVQIQLTHEAEKLVPVVARYVGELVGGELTGLVCRPERVLLRGPSEALKGVEHVQTQLIDIRGRTRTFETEVKLVPPSDKWEARFTPSTVNVTVGIDRTLSTRRWDAVPVLLASRPGASLESLVVSPDRVAISVTGRPDLMEKLREEDVRVLAECGSVAVGITNEVRLTVFVPAAVEADTAAEPPVVRVWRPAVTALNEEP